MRYEPDLLPQAAQRDDASPPRRAAAAAAPRRSTWSLETSIWAPRVKHCDAAWFYDTPSVKRRMFEADWQAAHTANRNALLKFILRHDDDAGVDLDGDGVPDEVQETAEALWEVHDLLYGTFDFYAALSDRDPFTISQKVG